MAQKKKDMKPLQKSKPITGKKGKKGKEGKNKKKMKLLEPYRSSIEDIVHKKEVSNLKEVKGDNRVS